MITADLMTAVVDPDDASLIEEGMRTGIEMGRFGPIEYNVPQTAGDDRVMRSQGEVEILKGLNAGERIVVSGQFLIDSEANLQASFRRFGGN